MTASVRSACFLLATTVVLASTALAEPHAAKKKKKKEGDDDAPPKTATLTSRELGVGLGLQSAYPPMPALEGAWRLTPHVVAGLDIGFLAIPVGTLSASGSYFGLSGRWTLGVDRGFAVALAVGQRHLVIQTVNNIDVNGASHDVTWTRTIDQTLIFPKVGIAFGGGKSPHGGFLGAGVSLPLGSGSFNQERDVESIEGYPETEWESQEDEREADVRKFTDGPKPSFEAKYTYYFDVLK